MLLLLRKNGLTSLSKEVRVFKEIAILRFRSGESAVGGPEWTKVDQFRPKRTKMDHFGPFWSRECQNPVRNKVKIQNGHFDHFGPSWSSTPSDRTATPKDVHQR